MQQIISKIKTTLNRLATVMFRGKPCIILYYIQVYLNKQLSCNIVYIYSFTKRDYHICLKGLSTNFNTIVSVEANIFIYCDSADIKIYL